MEDKKIEGFSEAKRLFERMSAQHNFELFKVPLADGTNLLTIYFYDADNNQIYVKMGVDIFIKDTVRKQVPGKEDLLIISKDSAGNYINQEVFATPAEGERFEKMVFLKAKSDRAQNEEWKKVGIVKPQLGQSQVLKEDLSRFDSAHKFEMFTLKTGENEYRRDAYYFDERTNTIYHFYSPMVNGKYVKSKYSTISAIKKNANGKFVESSVVSDSTAIEEAMKNMCVIEEKENAERDKLWPKYSELEM